MTIPDDIVKAARAVLTAPKHATRPHTELLLRIAGAIADERRRCAELVLASEPLAGPIVYDQVRAINGEEL